MTSSFQAEIEACYEAKKPYQQLLQQAIERLKHSQGTPESHNPSEEDSLSRQFLTFPAPKLTDFGAMSQPDKKAAACKIAAMRAESEKGKSQITKSEWSQIDKMLGN
ncbi:hypothetical protein MMC19_001016 [Ptychographa xylographoides]|nr:hypothetical protein [Ptychographa xylographoides]